MKDSGAHGFQNKLVWIFVGSIILRRGLREIEWDGPRGSAARGSAVCKFVVCKFVVCKFVVWVLGVLKFERRVMSQQPGNWFLHDGQQELGPLTEYALRTRLVDAGDTALPQYRVRQGNSDWFPAPAVLARFRDLAENGVYIQRPRGEDIEGPFTIPRALEIIAAAAGKTDDWKIKVGRNEAWRTTDSFLRWQKTRQPQSALQPRSGSATSGLVPAILIEEEPAEREVSPPGAAPKPPAGEVFVAALVDETVADETVVSKVVEAAPAASPPPVPPAFRPVLTGVSKRSLERERRNTKLLIAGALTLAIGLPLTIAGAIWWFAGDSLTASKTVITPPAEFVPLNPAGVGGEASGDPFAGGGGSLDDPFADPFSAPFPVADSKPPVVPPGSLFRPDFFTTAGPVQAGTAFAARLRGSEYPLILSSLHLLGPAGGLPDDLPAEQVPQLWQGLDLSDCVSGESIKRLAGEGLLIAEAKPFPESSPRGDVIAYQPSSVLNFRPFPLADSMPRAGETVWLVSEVIGSQSLTHRATVRGIERGWLAYEFAEGTLELRATSGAPVLNTAGQVVAINAGGRQGNGVTIGMGSPVDRFYDQLQRAAKLR
jgi:hypothetical protein